VDFLNKETIMYLNPQERQALRDASIGGIVAIRQLVAQLKQVNRQAFHTEQTLARRACSSSTPCIRATCALPVAAGSPQFQVMRLVSAR
jgi:hypothetical protein